MWEKRKRQENDVMYGAGQGAIETPLSPSPRFVKKQVLHWGLLTFLMSLPASFRIDGLVYCIDHVGYWHPP